MKKQWADLLTSLGFRVTTPCGGKMSKKETAADIYFNVATEKKGAAYEEI